VLRLVKQKNADVEVIVVSGAGTIESAVEAMKLRAFDFITKPFQIDEILLRVRNALEKSRLREEVRQLRLEVESAFGLPGIIGRSEAIRQVLSVLPRIAQTDSTVLITGESGTGKELIARAISAASRRSDGPFISVNCAAFPEQLLENELFGAVKGAYTDAVPRKGLFEEADRGTFFLDEIGETPPPIQVKLLRVLEERSIRRLGDNRSIPVDVRLVAATNQNLEELIKTGRFRADLFYRLNVVPVRIPPLRQRVEDIPLLIAHFIDKYNQKNSKQVSGLTREAKALMMAYGWPGNVRELENVVQRMIVVSTAEILDVADLPPEMRALVDESHGKAKGLIDLSRETTDLAQKQIILEALTQQDWNVTRTAKSLGISRATLQNKMKTYGIRKPRR
jgi:DNA-binding NtrC family response regulator